MVVKVRNGYKYYGGSSNPKIVLNYLNMNVEKGSIYGLLGASGCGKTTLLSCIVGQKQLNTGDIRVLGIKPGVPGSGIPGPLVGYMPQEIALVEEMTIEETLYYFGRIYDFNDEKIQQRYNLLKNLLELPPANRLVGQCSGGQKRRVSFACALIHEPQLLILDEPTVGLDPILREKIWDFLLEITRNSQMAVIITTHYIEEANKANRIGLMRNGILLAEDTPINIMHNLECNSLEESFLKLSQRQGSADFIENVSQGESSVVRSADVEKINQIQTETDYVKLQGHKSFTTRNRMKALFTKSVIQILRQPLTMLFMFLLPIIALTFYFWSIGLTPRNLRVGIVNDEVTNYDSCFNKSLITIINHNHTCEFNKISCRYINELNSDYAEKVFYNSTEEAHKSAKEIEILGYIHFPHNFSQSMQSLIENGRFTEDSVLDSAQMTVRLDMTDQQAAYFLRRRLLETYGKFMENIMTSCNLPKGLGRPPVYVENTLYGSFDDEYQIFITPGGLITVIYFLQSVITTGIFISERYDGIWDRTLVAGISTSEMLMAHLIFQSIIMIMQCLATIYYSIYVFGLESQGDIVLVVLLLVLDGFCGMIFGLFISIYCSSHMLSMFVQTAVFYPIIILSGFLWPIQGIYKILQDLVYLLPFTIPAISIRNVLRKGWSILNSQVYGGFIVLILWIIVLFVFCVIGLKRKL